MNEDEFKAMIREAERQVESAVVSLAMARNAQGIGIYSDPSTLINEFNLLTDHIRSAYEDGILMTGLRIHPRGCDCGCTQTEPTAH